MRQKISMKSLLVVLVLTLSATTAQADVAIAVDSFGTGANQFTLNFVPISGSTNPSSGYRIVENDYRMGMYEITNDQWNKFTASLGVPVTGTPSSAYDGTIIGPPHTYDGSFHDWGTGTTNVPTNMVSWYEAAQFVNWLNTSTGHQTAYKFTGTQGQSDYTLGTWSAAEAAGGTNLYRHKDAFYFLPTEDEWFKAAYWNGTSIQDYATKPGDTLHQGDGTSGTGWNYWDDDDGCATDPSGPWDVGSGSEELNGTYDMMGNVWEWTESPYSDPSYATGSTRALRGGVWTYNSYGLDAFYRYGLGPASTGFSVGFRVASVPEPGSITLLLCGLMSLICLRRRK